MMTNILTRLIASLPHIQRLDHLHEHAKRQENTMAKLSDELDDIARRQVAIKDALAASTTNTRDALTRLEAEVDALRDGELTDDQQARVDAIKSAADDIRAAAESADDGYEPPVVEPAPVDGVEGEPAPGSVEDRDTRSL